MRANPISLVAAGCLATIALAASCRSPAANRPETAIMCPHCETVWVETTDFDDPYRMSTTQAEVMRCPDCESAVAHFFETGSFEHACATCGELKLCKLHE